MFELNNNEDNGKVMENKTKLRGSKLGKIFIDNYSTKKNRGLCDGIQNPKKKNWILILAVNFNGRVGTGNENTSGCVGLFGTKRNKDRYHKILN